MAKATQKDLEPIMRLLDIGKRKDIDKANEEHLLPLLKKFEEENKAQIDGVTLEIQRINELVNDINKQVCWLNGRKALRSGARKTTTSYSGSSRFIPRVNQYVKPNFGSPYSFGGKVYDLTSEQYGQVSKKSNEIYEKVNLKYLTLEAKIKLSGDFKEVAKILTDNGILIDGSVK